MKRIKLRFVVALATAVLIGQAKADLLSPTDFTVATSARAVASDSPLGPGVSDSQSSAVPSVLLSTSSFTDTNTDGGSVTSSSTVQSAFSTADQGTISLTAIGYTLTQPVSFGQAFETASFTYEFTTSVGGMATLGYLVSVLDDTGLNGFGLQGFQVSLGSNSDTVGGDGTYGFDASGTLNYALTAGTTYTLSITNFANIGGGLPGPTSQISGTFDFQFAAVPEPSSLTLLGVSTLGLLGYIGRRRSRI